MIISISIHYDAGNECAVIHTIQQENLHATVAMATIHNCAYNGLEIFFNPFTACNINGYHLLYITMEGNYALILIYRANYCTLMSLDTGLDVAHVVYSLMYVHVAWSWPVAVARTAYSCALVRRRAVEGGAGARSTW